MLLVGALLPLLLAGVELDEEGWLGLIAAMVLLGGAAFEGWAGRAYGRASRVAEIALVLGFFAALTAIWSVGWDRAAPPAPLAWGGFYYEPHALPLNWGDWARLRPNVAPGALGVALGLVAARGLVGNGGLVPWAAVSGCCALACVAAGNWWTWGLRWPLAVAIVATGLTAAALLARQIVRRDPIRLRPAGTVLAGFVVAFAYLQSWALLWLMERDAPDDWFLSERLSAGWPLVFALGPAVLAVLLAPRDPLPD